MRIESHEGKPPSNASKEAPTASWNSSCHFFGISLSNPIHLATSSQRAEQARMGSAPTYLLTADTSAGLPNSFPIIFDTLVQNSVSPTGVGHNLQATQTPTITRIAIPRLRQAECWTKGASQG